MKSFFIFAGLLIICPPIQARPIATKVALTWSYENFPGKIKLYTLKPGQEHYISKTAVAVSISESPVLAEITSSIDAKYNGSTPLALVVQNDSEKDIFFYAVPHEMNPHHASAGHYFECLCVGRVYRVPAKKVWYRIVRINLNESFKPINSFEINHKIIGIDKNEAESKYKDKIYE